MHRQLTIIPEHIIKQYDLYEKQKLVISIWKLEEQCMDCSRQASLLAGTSRPSKKWLLWSFPHPRPEETHLCPISFTLIVDDFGIKYVIRKHADHLLAALQEHYTLDIDWAGKLYCGITLDWDYENGTVDISMPGYIKKLLHASNMRSWNHNTAHIEVPLNSMGRMPNSLYQSTIHQNSMKR